MTSTILAVKATPKALKAIENAANEKGEELTKLEVVKTTAQTYIPTAITCLSTIVCILGANALSKKQQASLISAYALLDDTFKKYRKAAVNVYGENADSQIKAEMAKMVYVTQDGYSLYEPDMDFDSEKLLFHDFVSHRYFNATLPAVLNAQYHLNRNLQLRGYVTLNEFYSFIGIDPVENGDDIGWNMDYILIEMGMLWLDFENKYMKLEDGMECCIISPFIAPLPFDVMENEFDN